MKSKKDDTMKRLLALLTVITAFAFAPVIADANEGVFTVKQFNLKNKVDSISEALLAMNNQSSWQDEPVAGQYPIIAFYRNLDPNSLANFKSSMVPFPGTVSKPGCFVVKITGTINIPESGNWTFACGSDDGFKVTISGNGFSKRFAYPSARMSDTSLKTFSFPNAGEYVIHLVYFNKGMDSDLDYETNWGVYDHAELEFSMAKGSYSSFNSSAFSLVRASSGEEYHDIVFDANGGEGEMEAQVIVHGGKCTLSANAFFLNGYVFQGWATSTNGPVVYSDGAEITVDSDKTLYAVWNNPALKLEAESAD